MQGKSKQSVIAAIELELYKAEGNEVLLLE
jgi:hypothetical protein